MFYLNLSLTWNVLKTPLNRYKKRKSKKGTLQEMGRVKNKEKHNIGILLE